MKLYIEAENNQPKNHPAFEDNLIQAFGQIQRIGSRLLVWNALYLVYTKC